MNPISQFFLHSEVGHFVLYLASTAIIGGMPAPTKDSGVAYNWAFASLNSFAMNFARAFGSKVEKSPNFAPAIVKQADIGNVQLKVPPDQLGG
jgi:hypothetical protein